MQQTGPDPPLRARAATTTSGEPRAASRSATASDPSVASIGDHARMLAALDREQNRTALLTFRRLIELERELSRVIER